MTDQLSLFELVGRKPTTITQGVQLIVHRNRRFTF
jgi:hypothetical protein